MQITREMSDQFFLTDLVQTPTYKKMEEAIRAKYPLKSQDEDLPDAYWNELNQSVNHLLISALAMNVPHSLN